MKRVRSLLLVLVLMLAFTACGKGSDKPAINNELNVNATNNDKTPEEIEIYDNKVYYVGDDIPEGSYVVNCTKSEYGMDIIIFKSKTEYAAFQNADQFTVGEYSVAIEQNAWTRLYVKENELAYVGLNSGNVILLDDGMCEFNKYDTANSNALYSGIYVVGNDIAAGDIDIKCTADGLRVVLFDSADKYAAYHKTSRFTVGEESDAIEANASSNNYVSEGKTTSIKLDEGMVMMIEGGVGEYSAAQGPEIN